MVQRFLPAPFQAVILSIPLPCFLDKIAKKKALAGLLFTLPSSGIDPGQHGQHDVEIKTESGNTAQEKLTFHYLSAISEQSRKKQPSDGSPVTLHKLDPGTEDRIIRGQIKADWLQKTGDDQQQLPQPASSV